jgi:hypothetical protein
MPQDEFRIFLSAVTSEFGRARDAVAADLRSREALLRVQSDFRQEAGSDTTLKKLHDYIRDCSAVACVIGKRSSALPPPKAAEPFAHMLPSGIAKHPIRNGSSSLRATSIGAWRVLTIRNRFARATGHEHANLKVALTSYVQILGELGRTKAEIEAAHKSVLEDGRQPPQ